MVNAVNLLIPVKIRLNEWLQHSAFLIKILVINLENVVYSKNFVINISYTVQNKWKTECHRMTSLLHQETKLSNMPQAIEMKNWKKIFISLDR